MLLSKCFNPECYCYGQYQLAQSGSCEDCGAPLHRLAGPVIGPEPTTVEAVLSVIDGSRNWEGSAP